jgi:diadenosine tetraphosphate (Ap4A) HIT family hydrolase
VSDFILHPRLADGGYHLATIRHCEVLLKNNAHYAWFIIVPRIDSTKTEITLLSESEYADINACTLVISHFIEVSFSPHKINIGNIGNIVSQMHIHVIGRSENDPAWPEVVWGNSAKIPYSNDRVLEIKRALKDFLKKNPLILTFLISTSTDYLKFSDRLLFT